jgi:hypothetical protein
VSENVVKLYEKLNPNLDTDPLVNGEPFWQEIPPVPTTSIYSKSDGVTSWQYCVDSIETSFNENIGIFASHLGLTHNAQVFHLVANRLEQDEKNWKPYVVKDEAKRWFFKASM